MFQYLKELYLATFVIFCRLSSRGWSRRMSFVISVCIISVIESSAIIGVDSYLVVSTKMRGLDISEWAFIVVLFSLIVANRYLLVVRGYGVKFDQQFTNLKRSRKLLLMTSSAAVMLAAIAFFLYSSFVYRAFISRP